MICSVFYVSLHKFLIMAIKKLYCLHLLYLYIFSFVKYTLFYETEKMNYHTTYKNNSGFATILFMKPSCLNTFVPINNKMN